MASDVSASEDGPVEPGRTAPGWRRTALIAAGVSIAAAGAAVVATLAATHRSAVTENAIAYVNGFGDGFSDGYGSGLIDGFGASSISD